MSVLVTDASGNHALAVVRSLGRRGIRVAAADSAWWAKAGFSRYCATRAVYPSASRGIPEFLAGRHGRLLLPSGRSGEEIPGGPSPGAAAAHPGVHPRAGVRHLGALRPRVGPGPVRAPPAPDDPADGIGQLAAGERSAAAGDGGS